MARSCSAISERPRFVGFVRQTHQAEQSSTGRGRGNSRNRGHSSWKGQEGSPSVPAARYQCALENASGILWVVTEDGDTYLIPSPVALQISTVVVCGTVGAEQAKTLRLAPRTRCPYRVNRPYDFERPSTSIAFINCSAPSERVLPERALASTRRVQLSFGHQQLAAMIEEVADHR